MPSIGTARCSRAGGIAGAAEIREEVHDSGLAAFHGMDRPDSHLRILDQRVRAPPRGDIPRKPDARAELRRHFVSPPIEQRAVVAGEGVQQ